MEIRVKDHYVRIMLEFQFYRYTNQHHDISPKMYNTTNTTKSKPKPAKKGERKEIKKIRRMNVQRVTGIGTECHIEMHQRTMTWAMAPYGTVISPPSSQCQNRHNTKEIVK